MWLCFETARVFLSFPGPINSKHNGAHGKEAKLSFRRVADVPEASVVGRRSVITLNQDL